MTSRGWLWALAGAVAAVAFACTDAYLYDQRRNQATPVDRTLALDGRFCTLGTNDVTRPIKILVALDASQSMKVSDPDGQRATAVVELINNLPNDPEIYLGVMLFAGSTTAYLTGAAATDAGGSSSPFVQVSSMSSNDKIKLISQILNFRDPNINRDSTDFVKPLADIYAVINADITSASLDPAHATARARYSVIFLSDGHPTFPQDDQLIKGDAVVRIRQLRDLAEDVRVNTVHVFNPTQPVSTACDLTGDGGCQLLIITQDAQRLQKMAELGGGDFRDFSNGETINFLNFNYGQVRRAWVMKDFVVSNLDNRPDAGVYEVDSDGDGLSDWEELNVWHTDPLKKDTDGDGFSDGVEVRFIAAGFHPNQPALPDGGGLDPGCPPALRGVDSDCDGVLDCDEQIIGTNPQLTDSDNDGVPDGIEWQVGTQPSSDDMALDPDLDGLTNRQEVRLHTNPLAPDVANLTLNGYRYTLEADGPPDSQGRQCYRFRVENISLEDTLPVYYRPDGGADGGSDAGFVLPDIGEVLPDGGILLRGRGFNDIVASLSMVPADDPTARTEVRSFRSHVARYPVGGIKSPVDGVIHVAPENFVDRCGGADGGVAAGY